MMRADDEAQGRVLFDSVMGPAGWRLSRARGCGQGERMTMVEAGGAAAPARLAAWPDGQPMEPFPGEPAIATTHFRDTGAYHPALIARLLELARDPDTAVQQARAVGGTKIYHIHQMQTPELAFICARAPPCSSA